MGMNGQVGFPDSLIKITKQGITTATFVVNDVFDLKVTSVSVQYRSDTGIFDCVNFGKVQDGWTFPVEAVCVDGMTQVNVVVDFGQQGTSEACEQCSPPDDASISTVFYSYEIDCYPVCETEAPSESPSFSKSPTSAPSPGPSSGPTPCIEKAVVELLEKLGAQDIPQDPLDLITITSQNTSSVGFVVSPTFADSVSVISVHYYENEGSIDCDVNKNVLRNTVLPYAAFCVDGFADVSIYIQPIGSPVEECLSCMAPGDSKSAVNAYYYKIPCLPVCEPIVKLATPALAAPSPSPQTVLDIDCYTGAVDVTPIGASKCPYGGENPIVITSMDQASVTFQVKNTFGSFSVCESSDFTVRFQQKGISKPTCNPPHVAKFSEYTHVMYRAMCVNGFAEVEIFASCKSGGQSRINPNRQTFDNSCGGTSECSHLFVVPCNPNDMCTTASVAAAVSPTSAPVPSTVTVQKSLPSTVPQAAGQSKCAAKLVDNKASAGTKIAWPANALALDADCSDGKVKFNVTQKWKSGSISWMNMMRDENFDGIWETCDKKEGVLTDDVSNFNVACPVGGGNVRVQITLHDGSPPFKSSNNTNNSNGVCGGWPKGDGVVVYTLIFSCDKTMSGSRRLDSSENTVLREEEDDLPYCLSEDFPCEGEEANMVYVCHYSARKGYQTFCVPETDSDILRFYANDYCGSCEGGRGATWGRFAING